MEHTVKNTSNEAVGTVNLDDSVFGQERRLDLIAAMVRYQRAKRRAGSASTKTRSQVAGGGSKPYRQKGTGNARQGTVSAPQYRSGGVVFGPHPRDYAHKMPKKMRKKALKSALSGKREDGEMVVLDGLSLDGPKTKRMRSVLSVLDAGKSTLVVLAENDANVELSARNLPGVTVMRSEGVNVYDLLRHETFLITQDAVKMLEGRLV